MIKRRNLASHHSARPHMKSRVVVSSLFIFFSMIFGIDLILTFPIRGVEFSFDKVLFLISGSLFRLFFCIPFLAIIIAGNFIDMGNIYQIFFSLVASWATWGSMDFFMGKYIYLRYMGLDLVADGQVTTYGLFAGLIFASRDVLFAFLATYIVFWRSDRRLP